MKKTKVKNGQLYVMEKANSVWRLAAEDECWHCGKMFVHRIESSKGRYCSRNCALKELHKMRRAKYTVIKRCQVCRTPYRVALNQRDRRKSCGNRACAIEIRRRNAIRMHQQGILGR